MFTEPHTFSRRDIVLGIADQDGGGHVDKTLDHAYFELTRENQMGHFSADTLLGDIPAEEFLALSKEGSGMQFCRALVRQITHEVLVTLLDDSSEYVAQSSAATKQKRHMCVTIKMHLVERLARRHHWS